MRHPLDGAVAQLGERVVRNDEVRSSILLSSTIGIIASPFFGRAARAQAHAMQGDAAFRAPKPPKKAIGDLARSEARQIVNWTYGDDRCRIALFFLKASPLDCCSQISFFCELRQGVSAGATEGAIWIPSRNEEFACES